LADEGSRLRQLEAQTHPSGSAAPLFSFGSDGNADATRRRTMRILLVTGGMILLAVMPVAGQESSDSTSDGVLRF